jgi:hypothetical protein
MKAGTNSLRIVLGSEMLASYPQGGGVGIGFLQYLFGLADLGHDVFWLELLRSSGDAFEDRRLIAAYFRRLRHYGFAARCALLLFDMGVGSLVLESAQPYGMSAMRVREILGSADLLWSFAGAVPQPLLSLCKRPVYVDGDPGHLQVSALEADMGLHNYAVLLSVGSKLNDPDCEVPTLGLRWHTFMPYVFLPLWTVAPDLGLHAPFSSVTHWEHGEVWLGDRALSISKRDAYLRYLELPERAARPFMLAANIHPDDDSGDRERLQAHGWTIAHPYAVAATPAAYRRFIRSSRAEIACVKPVYRELKTGWFSDRSACYLACGRPVLAEATGFSDHLPTGQGVLAFQDMDSALAGVAEIDAHYARHARAARELAVEYLGSPRCLEAMLSACG